MCEFFISRYLHKRPGRVQVDEKSPNLDQAKNNSTEICIVVFFLIHHGILSLIMKRD